MLIVAPTEEKEEIAKSGATDKLKGAERLTRIRKGLERMIESTRLQKESMTPTKVSA